jgi:Flp pilus assembly protein TadD
MKRRSDQRRAGALITLLVVLVGGFLISSRDNDPPPAAAAAAPQPAESRRRFDQAVVMLHARQYEHAVTALHRVLMLSPQMPEAHVNMGFALLGLKRVKEARDFFDGATALRPDQANAYYGLALAYEASGDLPMATGAMRSYLHLARNERPEHLRRARAALWEWEQAGKPR